MAFGLISAAGAQPSLTCNAHTVPPVIRSEGLAEILGDLLLTCTGGTPTAATTSVPQANLTVFLEVPLTSRILGPDNGSEALLLVDEPEPANHLACASLAGCTYPGGAAGPKPNVFEGVVAGNAVTFFGVPIDPPGSGGLRIYRITNLRANASALPLPPGMPGQLLAMLSVSGGFFFPIENPQHVVGFVWPGFAFSLRTADNQDPLDSGGIIVPACTELNETTPAATLRFTENFSTAAKVRTAAAAVDIHSSPPPAPQDMLGMFYGTESGFYNPMLAGPNGGLSTAGLADFGTRFKATVQNIPPGVSVWVTTTNLNPTATTQARLVAGEAAPFAPAPKTDTFFADVRRLAVAGGTATAVWEVLAAQFMTIDNFDFGLSVGGVPNPAGPAAVTVAGTAAPAAPAFRMPEGGLAQPAVFPIPRFLDATAPLNLFATAPCSVTSVAIAIKPGDPGVATINPRSRGRIPVAVLSTLWFDAPASVDRASLTFGRTGTEPSLAMCNPGGEDVNRDGRPDLVCHFQTELTGLQPGDKTAVLKGVTTDGAAFTSSAPIRTVLGAERAARLE